jgi:hypothetical protein
MNDNIQSLLFLSLKANELNIVTEYNKYLITNLVIIIFNNINQLSRIFLILVHRSLSLLFWQDAFTLDYEFLEDNNKNITTLSLINVELLKNDPYVRFATNYKVSYYYILSLF